MDPESELPQDPIERSVAVAAYTMYHYEFRYHGVSNGGSPQARQDNLTDLLTHLRHWADANGLDFEYSARWSDIHHEAELTARGNDHA